MAKLVIQNLKSSWQEMVPEIWIKVGPVGPVGPCHQICLGVPGRKWSEQWLISPTTYKSGIPWCYNPLILTIDPNFLKHPVGL